MARGDAYKSSMKTIQQIDLSAPVKKPVTMPIQPPKKQEQKNYGAWGPIFKDKKSFTEMHLC
ncbi:unnamed protein product [Leptidea sinapis]|uniref:Uncharacterized protein n=1 Tax=Leptidea sinapis TaxID=189913 RepID=A0A5E4QZA5_9NEOP|nr:unnamed protein product [Leptidea sinapis]